MTQAPRKVPKPKTEGSIDTELVRKIAELLQQSDLSEIEVQKDDFRVRVVRHSAAPASFAAPAPVYAAALPAAAPPAARAPAEQEGPIPGALPSPMVGTAYRRASPGSKAFVEIGSKVAAGEKLLLIEAMKTFNDILAPRAGIITAIMIEDGQPVEYGQPLLVIE